MTILTAAILIFILLESLNVMILYFQPDSKKGNGVAVFDAWEALKAREEDHLFASYMTNWVAGTKLIFIVLLIVILVTGSEQTQLYAVVAMVASIATYFWRLHPIICRLDGMGKISPKGYSKTLGMMIQGFLILFSSALILHLGIRLI